MAKVIELLPGQVVTQGGHVATFISLAPHPMYPALLLVIWKLGNGTWSLDALSPGQEVGDAGPAEPGQCWQRIVEAFRDGS